MSATSAYDTALQVASSPFFIKKNLLHEKSLTVGYLLYRVARPLLKVNYKIFKALNPERPWTSQAAIRIFEKLLTKEMIGFEYGSGNSTIFFAKHLKQLTSIEHNKEWFENVKNKLQEKNLNNVDYQFAPPSSMKADEHYTFYKDFNLTQEDFQIRKDFHEYFSVVKTYPDHHFDFIIVDGRARVECCLNSIPKLKSGGIFVLDNSERKRYELVFKVLSAWKSINTTNGLTNTTFWFKP